MPPAHRDPTGTDRIRVLCVDDDPAFLDLASTFLERNEGFTVDVESDPSSALSRLGDVDCVVSDYDMPGMNGLELLSAVRDRREKLPFVLFTGKGSEEIASEAIAAGASGYLQKGGSSQTYELLANRIESVVAETRARHEAVVATDRLQETYDRVTDGVIGVDIEWQYTYFNSQAEELLGVDGDDLLGKRVWDVFPDLVGTTFEASLREAMVSGEPVSFDAYFGPLDTHFEVRAFPGDDGLSIYVRDITDEQETRAELAAERRLLEAALDAVDDVFYVLDETGDSLIRWNDELREVTGLTETEMEQTTVTELFHPDDREGVRDTVSAVLGGEARAGKARFRTPEGYRLFEFSTVPLRDGSDELVGACGIGRDVTAQHERERRLERVESIVETVGDPVYTTDPAGRITYVNDAFARVTGHAEADALGVDAASLLMDETGAERAAAASRQARESGRPVRFEFELKTADERSIPCEEHLTVVPNARGRHETAGVVRDISRRKEREATLRRQRDRLDRFASLLSHDLRNPLSVAAGHVELAQETGETTRLSDAGDALGRMEELIDELLELARSGQTISDPEPVDLRAVVEEAWTVTDTGDATLEICSLPTATVDASRVSSLFENLFRNAVEHGSRSPRPNTHEATPRTENDRMENAQTEAGRTEANQTEAGRTEAGRTESECEGERSPVHVRVEGLGDGRGFRVEDDGVGFPPGVDSQTLFSEGVSTATEGTGYGLAIVRDVAEAHGWTVRAESGPDGGAVIEFRF